MDALRRKAESDVADVSRRLRQSEQRREELTDLKFAHEAELRELRGKSEAGEAGREAASNDAKSLREANRALEARVFEAEREAERLRMQSAALAQQVRSAARCCDVLRCRKVDGVVLGVVNPGQDKSSATCVRGTPSRCIDVSREGNAVQMYCMRVRRVFPLAEGD